MRVHWLVNAILLVCRFTLLLRGQTLRPATDEDGLLPGTAVRSAQLSEPAYASALAREFKHGGSRGCDEVMGTAAQSSHRLIFGWPMKWFASRRRILVKVPRGHCLVRGRYNPDGLTQGHFTNRQLAALLQEHMNSSDAALGRAGLRVGCHPRSF
jgi:hypothetical protein